jgi:hypothetical protein
MSQETGDLTKKTGGQVATLDFVSDSGMGLENIDRDDLALPFLKLLQSGSDETKKKHAKYVEGAEAGMFYNTVTKKLYDGEKGIQVIPVFYGNEIIKTANHFVIILGDRPEKALMTMKSTQLKVSRNWNSLCENEFETDTKTGKSVPAPMFSRVYKLNSVENSGSFTWHGYNVNLLRKVDDAGIYQMARDFHNSLKKGQAKAEAYSEEESNY